MNSGNIPEGILKKYEEKNEKLRVYSAHGKAKIQEKDWNIMVDVRPLKRRNFVFNGEDVSVRGWKLFKYGVMVRVDRIEGVSYSSTNYPVGYQIKRFRSRKKAKRMFDGLVEFYNLRIESP